MNRRATLEELAPAQSLSDQAYAVLEEMIITLKLPPGSSVSEATLSAHLGIGRTPIREALQRLARERLVQILPRRGIIVSEINATSQLLLLEVRREMERLIVRSAARRASEAERESFRSLAVGFEEAACANDGIVFMRIDREFNILCSQAAHNEFAAGAMSLMHALSRRFWFVHHQAAANMPQTAALHADIARAIAGGHEERAARASDKLLDSIEKFTRAAASPS